MFNLPQTGAMALLAFATFTKAHMIMNTPVPFDVAGINNSPLDANGDDWPCKVGMQGYNINTITSMNNITAGQPQTLSFKGSAVHGGGSCQIALTMDKTPSKNSEFKVIHSIIGGCPSNVSGNLPDNSNGNGAATFQFTVPQDMPNGQYSLAWVWYNKVGNREIYMNCAPVSVSGGVDNQDAFNNLPSMFVANLPPEAPYCVVPEDKNIVFPNPGDSVQTAESTDLATAGSMCTAVGPSGEGKAAAGAAAPATAAASASGNTGAASAPAATSAPASMSAAAASTPVAAVSAPVAAASTPAAVSTPAAAASAPYVAPSGASNASGACPSGSQPCTTAGAVVCFGTSSFGLCDLNMCAVPQAVASGTQCSGGAITRKRSIKGHIRRHANLWKA